MSFTPEKEGNYVFQLVVSDGILESEPTYVTVNINSNRNPTAMISQEKISGGGSM